MQKKLAELKSNLSQYFLDNPNAARTKIYYLWKEKKAAAAGELMRIGGAPIGFASVADFPKDSEAVRMEHILTLDVERLPLLAAKLSEGTKAVSLFVSNPQENEAYEPESGYSALRFLTGADLAAAPAACADYTPYTPAKSVGIAELDFPLDCFDPELASESSDLSDLLHLLMNVPCYLLGAPIWIQGEEGDEELFLGQFDDKFADINLGDSGIMYLFSNAAFWQCY